jgi:PKD repeat protein
MRDVYIILALVLLGAACGKNPVFPSGVVSGPHPTASFTMSPDPSNAQEIHFTSTSANAQSYYWQFGDGTTSTDSLPVHTYAVAATYTIILVTRSAAGYSATDTVRTLVAAPATASFTTYTFEQEVQFSNASTAVDSVHWNYGDNSPVSDTLSPWHLYATPGTYTVTLTVYGLAGNVATSVQKISVANNNLMQGGYFEAGEASSWFQWNNQNMNPPVFGFTGGGPTGGIGGSLRFPSFSGSAGFNELIYQPVQVVAGKQYQMSALVKLPAGVQDYLQFYISVDTTTWIEPTETFMSLNAWHGWGTTSQTVSVDGNINQLVNQYGDYGFGCTTGGIYTAPITGTVYIGIQAGCYAGNSNGDFLIDNMSFVELP